MEKDYFWYGKWYPEGHNNCRYAALLPRIDSIEAVYQFRFASYLHAAIWQRLDKYLFSRYWYPYYLACLGRKHRALFCTNVEQIAYFNGPVVVDDDDPTFADDHINLLNSKNVVAVVTTTDLLKSSLMRAGLKNLVR